MTKEFEIAIEELYETFAKYRLRSTIEGCPCCVSNSDKAALHSKELRNLEDKDISRYAFKAMTTWGSVNDFKHFLPRIFELVATRELMVDTFIVLGKLDYGKWKEWERHEQDSILNFLKAWWKYDINNASYFDSEVLIEINKRLQNFREMLSDWDLSIENQGFRNYVNLIEGYYDVLTDKKSDFFNELSQDELQFFIEWFESNSNKLEEGFFIYDDIDKEFSTRISDALFSFRQK